ncbi:hypothetical protein [Rufibacter hautae]|uniref:SH3 domain-containing protein n=1 Tax=Rufibacter hautae TaxID=2595005 RepID=A0A5B6TMH6_9BACT|nr:hypothetical protein [Rufibacter hautae]KAA3440545.1 hypothetical protein FOA19_07805 [Rufibacter hautae]
MKNLLVLILLLLSSVLAEAQVAIINDKDGFTNVRKQPNGQAEIIYRISSNEVFWYGTEEDNGEWITVYIPKNKFSFSSTQPDYLQGFIHKSRLLHLEKVRPYKGSDFSFEYVIAPFNLKNRIVDKQKDKWVTEIDGRPVWGTDGNFPKTQVKAVKVKIAGQLVSISKAFYEDIYECTNTFKIYQNGDTYFVYQWNSDGAGSYQIVWVFTKAGLKQRLVGSLI